MKRLIIIRHAKSSWDGLVNDFDRDLEPRGIKDAHRIAQATKELITDEYKIMSSSARRASHTAQIFAEEFGINSINYLQELYTFDELQLERVIRKIDNQYNHIILFGHNEAITNFVNKFGSVFIPNVATSGFTMLEFSADNWQNISSGKTLKVLFPKDLR
jgi:phosphohistidine phosphatase